MGIEPWKKCTYVPKDFIDGVCGHGVLVSEASTHKRCDGKCHYHRSIYPEGTALLDAYKAAVVEKGWGGWRMQRGGSDCAKGREFLAWFFPIDSPMMGAGETELDAMEAALWKAFCKEKIER